MLARTTLSLARRASRAAIAPAMVNSRSIMHGGMGASDNVTYSGGQEGVQGGFYGSGGARAKAPGSLHHRPEAVAALEDIARLSAIMTDVGSLEAELARCGTLNAHTIEIKSTLKKTLSSPAMIELLNRLEINAEPVWGLTQAEREMVRTARRKVNTC